MVDYCFQIKSLTTARVLRLRNSKAAKGCICGDIAANRPSSVAYRRVRLLARVATRAYTNRADSPPPLRFHNRERHLLAFDFERDRLSIVGAFDREREQACGHLIAPGVEHGDEGWRVGLPR